MQRKFLVIGLIITVLSAFATPIQAQKKCTPLPLVGGKGSEVDKTITAPSIPGPFGIKIASDNWNTDWSIPNPQIFKSYKVEMISEEGGTFTVKMYLKYSDETADPFYERNELKLDAKKRLEVTTTNARQELPYQVNVFVGGVKSLGTQYRATAYGCQ